jgi:soluble epoxide hydrolase/lipid-phosphate phosphatase
MLTCAVPIRYALKATSPEGKVMVDLSRRSLLIGAGAAAVSAAMPAFAVTPAMPPVRMVRTNGINLAVYEAGSGPAIVLLHGFPGLAFSWRHQIPAFVAAGYRVIAPDLRGYGRSEAPGKVEDYDIAHLTGDLVGLLDALDVDKAIFVGHDWGGLLAWQMPLLHPRHVAGVIGVSTPYIPHWMLWLHSDLVAPALPAGQTLAADPKADPVAQMRRVYSPEMYVLKFQDGRSADDAMARDARATLRASYRTDLMTKAAWKDLPREAANMEYYGRTLPLKLPGRDVLNTAELDHYASHFQHTGFTPAINWYRNLSRNWKAGLSLDQTIRVPSLMVSGEHDVVLRPSMTKGMKAHVPDLERHVVANCWHWLPEEKPHELNRLALSWLARRFPPR